MGVALGTRDMPLVVDQVTGPTELEERTAARNHREREATNSRGTLAFTGLLFLVALIQAVLFIVQLKLMRASVLDATRAAESAKMSAEAFKVSQRAWVANTRINHSTFTNLSDPNHPGELRSGVFFEIAWLNAGNTPAVRCMSHIQGLVVSTDQPHLPTFDGRIQPDLQGAPLIPGVPVTGPRWYCYKSALEELHAGKCRVFIFGAIEYEDIFSNGIKRRTEVCLEVSCVGFRSDLNVPIYAFSAVGPQNTAT